MNQQTASVLSRLEALEVKLRTTSKCKTFATCFSMKLDLLIMLDRQTKHLPQLPLNKHKSYLLKKPCAELHIDYDVLMSDYNCAVNNATNDK